MCLYASTHTHTHTLKHSGKCMKLWLSVAPAVWLASPVTCQSVTARDGPHPSPQTCQRGGMTGDKAGVTDSDRAVMSSERHGQGAASPRVTLSDRVEACARGGMMPPGDRRRVHDAGLYLFRTHMHTDDQNARSYKHAVRINTHVSANKEPRDRGAEKHSLYWLCLRAVVVN